MVILDSAEIRLLEVSVCPTLHEQTRVDKYVESDGAISVSISKGLYGISMVL